MLATAERVAAEGGFSKEELDELTVRRYEQYEDALADDRAFQRRWMVPSPSEAVAARPRWMPTRRSTGHGRRPGGLAPVQPGGVVELRVADPSCRRTAGLVVTTEAQAASSASPARFARVLASGFAPRRCGDHAQGSRPRGAQGTR
jgi:acetyl-CoA C-acetyltransferase